MEHLVFVLLAGSKHNKSARVVLTFPKNMYSQKLRKNSKMIYAFQLIQSKSSTTLLTFYGRKASQPNTYDC